LTGSLYTEPDPEECYCLIGQKLQLFNLGLETLVMASELELQKKKTSIAKSLMHGSMVDGIPLVDEDSPDYEEDEDDDDQNQSMGSSAKSIDQFYEASDRGFDMEMTNHRKGARCPIHGAASCETGAQLYTPYLQRAMPLTDDVLAERKLVFLQQNSHKASITIEQRLEIAQRFQKPKLLSDMRSFKAANPGASFRDFIGWYGNPTDPLAEFQPPEHDIHAGSTADDTTVVKLDRAAEAIKTLEQTRDFWTNTWEEAKPIAAAEQEPLFDPESTVEVALDYLENLHPAILACQVMAVNLAMTHFSISASAGDAIQVSIVKIALSRLQDRIQVAVANLSRHVMRSFEDPVGPDETLVSTETIASCSKACEAVATAELIVARCLSLLHKLPQQYNLVERILNHSEGSTVDVVEDHMGRNIFLDSVWEQQRKLTKDTLPPQPIESEYMMRNLDDSMPSQLCVKYKGNKLGVSKDLPIETLLALSRTSRED
jgi:Rab3 GTPase-activating protein catalytic subunit